MYTEYYLQGFLVSEGLRRAWGFEAFRKGGKYTKKEYEDITEIILETFPMLKFKKMRESYTGIFYNPNLNPNLFKKDIDDMTDLEKGEIFGYPCKDEYEEIQKNTKKQFRLIELRAIFKENSLSEMFGKIHKDTKFIPESNLQEFYSYQIFGNVCLNFDKIPIFEELAKRMSIKVKEDPLLREKLIKESPIRVSYITF